MSFSPGSSQEGANRANRSWLSAPRGGHHLRDFGFCKAQLVRDGPEWRGGQEWPGDQARSPAGQETPRQAPGLGRPAKESPPCPASPAPLAPRSGRIRFNFNTKGILGRRKCITRKGDLGRGQGDTSLPPYTPALPKPWPTPTLHELGEFKQGALFPPAVVGGGRYHLQPRPSSLAAGMQAALCQGLHTCSLPPSFPSGCSSIWAHVCFSTPGSQLSYHIAFPFRVFC